MTVPLTPAWLREAKGRGEKIAALTAYDFPTAKLLDEAGVPLLLVGDSLGMVVLGYDDTTSVTLDEMLHHTRAVARGAERAIVAADLPYRTYDTPEQALAAARALAGAGAAAVKLEGGIEFLPQIEAIVAAGIPLIGHLGMLPQSVRKEGGYKVKGKTASEAEKLLADARALDAAGASAIVLELVVPGLAAEIGAAIKCPTIGIGAGEGCDGQILVTHDLVGLFPWFAPKFVKPEASLGVLLREAAQRFVARTTNKSE